jgi:hypothetical protein
LLAWQVVLAASVAGCSGGGLPDGRAADGGRQDARSSSPDAGLPGTGETGLAEGGVSPPAIDAGFAACVGFGRTVSQRLSRVEYANTVRDLLGLATDVDPARDVPPDERANVFDNNAALAATTVLHAQAYIEAAERLAAAVVTERPARVVSCWPTNPAEEPACARQILSALVSRAYRRPPDVAEVDAITALYEANTAAGFAAALGTAITGALVAPQFLFRLLGPGPGEAPRALTSHELASRLSYFLWRTMPDDVLRAAADSGQLLAAGQLAQQTKRMLADPKAGAFVDVLAEQWLGLRGLDGTAPDPSLYGDFYAQDLATSMRGETHTFLGSLLAGSAPFGELLTASYSYVDAKLAVLYGFSAPAAAGYGRFDLTSTSRRGVLGQASFLALNANADRTSVVKRGKWILSALLCSPLPDPPANVLQQLPQGGKARGQREELAEHRVAPECGACHNLLDPPGLALEGFDLLGRSRTTDEAGLPIDTRGSFADHRSFAGPAELSVLLRDDPRFAGCVSRNLFTYALARELGDGEVCLAKALAEAAPASRQTLAELVVAVVSSPAFLNQTAEDP